MHRLPGTLAALETGLLHAGHLWHLLDKVAPIADDARRAAVEAELLAWMSRRAAVTTPAQLGDRARRIVAVRDAREAARRLARALRERGVYLRSERAEGMAALSVVCTLPEARALHRALGACADALGTEPGDARSRGQRMVDCLLDLVLRPGECELPPVRVLLTVVASIGTLLGGDAPGEVDGQVVPAEMIRRLLQALTGHHPATDTERTASAANAQPPADAGIRAGAADAGNAAEPDTTATDAGPPDAAAPAAAAEGRWQQEQQAELERWWAELERRVLAEELGGGPDPAPDAPPDAAPPVEDRPPPDEPDGRPKAGTAADADSLPTPADIPHLDDPRPGDPAAGGPPGGGWWAAADRAVDAAGAAVHA
ncbi:13E12 repeat family protein, partial [Geodermatophilus sp. CPCC 205761]